jgi:multiple sugar transport system substrate-binding protein
LGDFLNSGVVPSVGAADPCCTGLHREPPLLRTSLFLLACTLVVCGCSRGPQDVRTTIEFWTYQPGGSTDRTGDFWRAVAARFERASPGVGVRVVHDIPHEYYMSMLGTRFIGRNPPDVMLVDDVELGDLAREGMLMPLEEFVRSDPAYRSADYAPSMVRDSFVDGVRYGIPWYGAFAQLTYRTDLLAQAGVRPPRAWNELLDVCRALQRKLAMRYPFAMDLSGSFWMINWVWQNGGDVVSPDGRRITVDTPEFVGAVQFVHDLMYKHRVMNPSLAGGTMMKDLWSSGQAAMMMDGAFMIGRYDGMAPQWKDKWDIAPLPAGRQDVSFYGGAHLVMSRITNHRDLAWRFMAYATSLENQRMFADITGMPPANLRVFDLPDFQRRHPHVARMREAIAHGRNNPLVPFFPKVWYEVFRNRVMDVVMGRPDADIAAAVRSAGRDMQRVADEYWQVHPRHGIP